MNLPYPPNSTSLIYACNILEHFGKNNNIDFFRRTSWKDVLEYWYSLLRITGELYISVPDFEAVCLEYLQNKRIYDIMGICIGGQKNEEDIHGMLFDFETLAATLKEIGFKNVQRYDWKTFEPFRQKGYDDYSASYLPHMDFKEGRCMMLNIKASK